MKHKGGSARFQRGSRAPKILKMHHAGVRVTEIARRLGCTPANVSWALAYYNRWKGQVDPLPEALDRWLVTEAEKAGVKPDTMARALLVDAINEAMEKSQ